MGAKKVAGKSAGRGRPSGGLSEVLYVRITPAMAGALSALCARAESDTGFPVSTADMVRKLVTDGISRATPSTPGRRVGT